MKVAADITQNVFKGTLLAKNLRNTMIPEYLASQDAQMAGFGATFYEHFKGVEDRLFDTDNQLNSSLRIVRNYLHDVFEGLKLANPEFLKKKYWFLQKLLLIEAEEKASFKHGVDLINKNSQIAKASLNRLMVLATELKKIQTEISSHLPTIECFISEGLSFHKDFSIVESEKYSERAFENLGKQLVSLSTFKLQLEVFATHIGNVLEEIGLLNEKFLEVERLILPIWKSSIYFKQNSHVAENHLTLLIDSRNTMIKKLT